MYPTMYLSKKSYIMLLIDLGQKIERPVKEEQIGKKTIIYYLQNNFFYRYFVQQNYKEKYFNLV